MKIYCMRCGSNGHWKETSKGDEYICMNCGDRKSRVVASHTMASDRRGNTKFNWTQDLLNPEWQAVQRMSAYHVFIHWQRGQKKYKKRFCPGTIRQTGQDGQTTERCIYQEFIDKLKCGKRPPDEITKNLLNYDGEVIESVQVYPECENSSHRVAMPIHIM